MTLSSSEIRSRALLETNRQFYNGLWGDAQLVEAERFNTWPLVQSLLPLHPRRLEVAPGLRPRLPIAGTQFVDISSAALCKLAQRGAQTTLAPIYNLPFADRCFDLLCSLDIIEHVEEDEQAIAELARVAAPGAVLLISTPLHQSLWTEFDDFVGHRRRYEPQAITALLAGHGFVIQRSAAFGMTPRSSWLLDPGMWFLKHHRKRSMWWYNKVLPYTARRQKPLQLQDGLMDTADVAEIFLVCRRK
jgi:SAM-dependent methyltransferase